MRYRRETPDGDYTFGQGDDTFLTDSPEAVAQAIKTRLALWQGDWFLDRREGAPVRQALLGKPPSELYSLLLRDRILKTPGVKSVLALSVQKEAQQRQLRYAVTVETHFGTTTVKSEE